MSTNQQSLDAMLQDAVPEMPTPNSTVVELQRGVYDATTDTWHSVAEVRELTGADEEYLASIEAKANLTYAEYMTALLKRAVISIGDMSIEDQPQTIDSVIISDRDILFLGIVKATYGVEKEFNTLCPSCSSKNTVTINLDEDFPIKAATFDLKKSINVVLRDGRTIKLRLPTGADSAYVGKNATTAPAQNTLMIARCTVWDANERPDNIEQWAKSLSLADRNKLVRALSDVQIGPKLEEVNVQCAHCGYDMPIRIDWISLLFS